MNLAWNESQTATTSLTSAKSTPVTIGSTSTTSQSSTVSILSSTLAINTTTTSYFDDDSIGLVLFFSFLLESCLYIIINIEKLTISNPSYPKTLILMEKSNSTVVKQEGGGILNVLKIICIPNSSNIT